MDRYDPGTPPDPQAWQALDDAARLALIAAFHRDAGIAVAHERLHAGMHAVVENQAALGDALPVRRALARLMAGGLDRHEAVHAVGAVVSDAILAIARKRPFDQRAYDAAVEALTAERWRAMQAAPDAGDGGGKDDPPPPRPPRRRRFRG